MLVSNSEAWKETSPLVDWSVTVDGSPPATKRFGEWPGTVLVRGYRIAVDAEGRLPPDAGRHGFGMDSVLWTAAEFLATMGKKSKAKKKRLAKKERQNTRVPSWVMMKTDMEVTRNPKRRNWRRSDLDE